MEKTIRKWTKDELIVLEASFDRGNTGAIIARILNRTEASIYDQARYRRIKLRRKRIKEKQQCSMQ